MIHLFRSRVVNDYLRRVAMSTFPSQVVVVDRFRGVNVDLTKDEASTLNLTSDTFDQVLKDSEECWRKEKQARAIWFKIPHHFSHLIPSLVSNQYDYHHAKPGFVQMVKWVSPDESNNIPSYPYTNIGVGAFVVDAERNVLLVQEKYSPAGRMWKYPGGYANKGEDFWQVAERECLEETGIQATFKTIIGFRHMHRFQFGASDIYIMCLLVPDESNKQIKACEHELLDATWMPIDQARTQVSKFNLSILERYEEYLKHGHGIEKRMVDFVLGGKVAFYSVSNGEESQGEETQV